MAKYKSILNEADTEFIDNCGHLGATPRTYTSVGVTARMANCSACHEQLSNQLTVIEKVKPVLQPGAHGVAARAGQIGLSPKTILRVLRAFAKISNEDEEEEPFVMAWAHWCWDNFPSKHRLRSCIPPR